MPKIWPMKQLLTNLYYSKYLMNISPSTKLIDSLCKKILTTYLKISVSLKVL